MSTFQDLKDRAQNMALVEDDILAGIFVNDVYKDLVVQGQLRCGSRVVPIASTENVYTIDDDWGISDFGMLQYMLYTAAGQTEGYILDQSDMETVLQLNSTIPTGYVRKYAFQGLDNVYLWPYPQDGTRYATTNILVDTNRFETSVTGIAANSVQISNVAAGLAPFTAEVTTAVPHDYSNGDAVYIAIPTSSVNGASLTSANPYTVTVTTPTTFTISFGGILVPGATFGCASTAPENVSLFGIGVPGVPVLLLVLNNGFAAGYVSLPNGLYGEDGAWAYVPGGDTLTLYYAQEPTELSLGLDEPSFVPTQWQHLISIGAAARLTDAVGEDIALSSALQNKYDALYFAFVRWVKNRQGRGTQMMSSGYTRSIGSPPHDRSAYYSPNVSSY